MFENTELLRGLRRLKFQKRYSFESLQKILFLIFFAKQMLLAINDQTTKKKARKKKAAA